MNSQENMTGLSRYRSAPSSYFASLLEGPDRFGSDDFERLFNPRASSPETQIIFSRFMNSGEAEENSFLAPTKIEPCETQQSNDVDESRINCEPLIRHSSSPAGLFANINIDEFGTLRSMGNIANAEASFCSTSRFKSQIMDPITEIQTKASFDDNDFPVNSWDDNDFLKEPNHQKNEGGNRPTARLSHHLSLPKSFGELSSMEKLLQDTVPCKIRAKRGCATHPRSIAERVRRTKISERMRKLQELVPNMEKQTSTSDMLDLAVEYIKDLQGQLKMLSDDREKCSCEAKLRP